MKVIVFSPHPDDDLIGCGGSIIKLIKRGYKVSIVYMTSGESGAIKYSKEELGKIREQEAKAAAKIVGVTELLFLRRLDGYLEYNRDNLIQLINLIRDKQPELVYVPHKNDGHKDHQKTCELVMEAIGRASGPWFQECQGKPWVVRTVLAYEVWTPLQEINYVENITDEIKLKIKALRQHQSQIKDIQYDKAIKGLNRYRGVMTGKGQYCECFQLLKAAQLCP